MPKIVNDEGILDAARSGIDVLLQFKGNPVYLVRRGAKIAKPGGGHDYDVPTVLPAQLFAVTQVGGDIVEDGADGDTPITKRTYALTGLDTADIRVDDTWDDDEADYRVESVNQASGYKTTAEVVGFVKVP
jgi:hypothetical protein